MIIGIGLFTRVIYIAAFGDIDWEYRRTHEGRTASAISFPVAAMASGPQMDTKVETIVATTIEG